MVLAVGMFDKTFSFTITAIDDKIVEDRTWLSSSVSVSASVPGIKPLFPKKLGWVDGQMDKFCYHVCMYLFINIYRNQLYARYF